MKICFIFCNFCLRLGEPRTSNKQLFGQHFFKEPKLSAASSHDRRSYLIAIAHNSIERTKNNLDSSSVASDPVTFVSSPLPRAQWPGRQRRRSRIRVLFLLSRSFIQGLSGMTVTTLELCKGHSFQCIFLVHIAN